MNEPLMFSVIIPTFNRKASLAECLRSLGRQSFPPDRFEVLVVDDGSSDGTAETVERTAAGLGFHVEYLRQSQQGPGAARNLGAKNARGGILAFTEDDAAFAEGVLPALRLLP